MKIHKIPLEAITSDGINKFGKPKKGVKIRVENGELHIPADESILGKAKHHVYVPGNYKLPFRIDMTAKTESLAAKLTDMVSQLTLLVGCGMVYFNGGHTSATDFLVPAKGSSVGDAKLTSFVAYNDMPLRDFADISVFVGRKMLWATVNGQICFASDKMPYMELLDDQTVDIAISGGTHTMLTISTLTITEYENDEPEIPVVLANLPEISSFEMYINGLPPEVHDELRKTDEFLLNDMKKSLKLRRSIDKGGHLLYQSPCGFHYRIREFGVHNCHETHWVKSANKPDFTSEALNKLAETSPDLANEMFARLLVCTPHARDCGRRTSVSFNGQTRQVCAGRIELEMLPERFDDVRKYIAVVGEVVTQKQGCK
ncbi:MAG: hypothetical protein FWE06_07215 [Oscillospiraceae bacterium]|nr:hypothetical protein [Oscillospiraceae bacterium]